MIAVSPRGKVLTEIYGRQPRAPRNNVPGSLILPPREHAAA